MAFDWKSWWRKPNWTTWRPRLLYGGFFVVAFLLALRWTFPAQAVKERFIVWAGSQGWQVDASEVAPAGFLGITARDVRAEGAPGQKLSVDRITASMRLLPLLVGRRSVAFDASLWDGRVRGTADLSGNRGVVARVESLDLAAATPLRRATGLELLGKLDGTVDVTVPADPAAKPSGRIELNVKDAGVNGGQVAVPSLGGAITVPKVALGDVSARLALADGKGTFERLEAKGGEAALATDGLYFVWQPRLQNAPLFGKARLRVEPAFWAKPASSAFKGVADLALGTPRDGAYELQVFGTLGQPQLRPTAAAFPPPSAFPPASSSAPASPPPQPQAQPAPGAEPTQAVQPAQAPPRQRFRRASPDEE
jgi:type II secretion system protein N